MLEMAVQTQFFLWLSPHKTVPSIPADQGNQGFSYAIAIFILHHSHWTIHLIYFMELHILEWLIRILFLEVQVWRPINGDCFLWLLRMAEVIWIISMETLPRSGCGVMIGTVCFCLAVLLSFFFIGRWSWFDGYLSGHSGAKQVKRNSSCPKQEVQLVSQR